MRQTTADAPPVVERLRQDILTAVFMPGERLVELELSERYGTGRPTVREALLQLESEGLVVREANKGAVVRRVSLAEAIEITEARQALESLIAAKAARHVTDEEAGRLEDVVARMRETVAGDDPRRYSALNRELHGLVHAVGRHAVASDMVANLRNRALHHQYRLAMMPGRQQASLAQHEAIVDAIVARDEDAAAAAMGAHLASVIDVLQQWGDAAV